jgi:Tfp pilus assembly protein PilF
MSRRPTFLVLAAVAVAAAVAFFLSRRGPELPAPGSGTYEAVTREFYRGLAALEVGLLDDARREFTNATQRVPEEPASWANLGLTRLRLGELDAAAEPIERALSLASDDADLVLMAGRMEIARGRLDEGLAHLRRVVELQPRAMQARFALADEVERAAGPDADVQAAMLYDELAQLAPNNPAVHVERARLAAKMRNGLKLDQVIGSLEPIAVAWPERALEQFRALRMAAAGGDFQRAQLTTTFLRNVLASVPSFIESLSAVRTPTELIAQPIVRFVVLASVSSLPSPADTGLAFSTEVIDQSAAQPGGVMAVPLDGEGTPAVLRVGDATLQRLDGPRGEWPLPAAGAATLAALDWNNDFRVDVAVLNEAGLRLLVQDETGAFRDSTRQASSRSAFTCRCAGIWPADVEMDGDLDIVAGALDGDPVVLRNNGDGTWTEQRMFTGAGSVRALVWADLDRDGDPDAAFLHEAGSIQVFLNRQAGDFVRGPNVPAAAISALTAADLDGDGRIGLIVLERGGTIRRIWLLGDRWASESFAQGPAVEPATGGRFRLIAADLDNNGALDVVMSGAGRSWMWLTNQQHRSVTHEPVPAGEVVAVIDLNADGYLDLLTASGGGVARHLGRGTANYHWKVIRPRAQPAAGDQRINAFGIGGDIEVRSGLLVQKHPLTGGSVHFGLGDRSSIDVARIVWPNGVAQAEFGTDVDDVLVAEQRLKGSCPWVFAWDGSRMAFVTDFLWRSPLGLRINAQDTAGVVQTEDWIRIGGDQLAPRNGAYDIRIAAELWETHFFDHVSLMVVDHPASTDIFVDERFSAASPPALAVHAVERRRPVPGARDQRGNDVTAIVAQKDGNYLATFDKGAYQGIAAAEHFVEFDPPPLAMDSSRELGREGVARPVLLASGWIYPTDSSINVAIGQGGNIRPMGLVLEAQTSDGRWRIVDPDLGFPAGKNKTLVIDLGRVGAARRLRLRTNLEIYWDALELASAVDATLRTTRLLPRQATLRYRGFSETASPRGEAPETPDYERLATTSQRWRDLTGYHTRFGDVNELLGAVDDRYVIMNAGDELRLLFDEAPRPGDGWRRDFVLIGDGWEKDGDYNTGFSQTVLPLPSHDRPMYGTGVTSLELEHDPVYQRHREDWQQYHTRYVTPRAFVSGLRY